MMPNNILKVCILRLDIFSTESQLNQSQSVDPEPDSPEGIQGSVTDQQVQLGIYMHDRAVPRWIKDSHWIRFSTSHFPDDPG